MKVDREGGRPLEISIKKSDLNGFIARQEAAYSRFIAPCVFSAFTSLGADQSNGSGTSASQAVTKEVNQGNLFIIYLIILLSYFFSPSMRLSNILLSDLHFSFLLLSSVSNCLSILKN